MDRSQDIEEQEEELVAGFDEDEDLALLRKEKIDLKTVRNIFAPLCLCERIVFVTIYPA